MRVCTSEQESAVHLALKVVPRDAQLEVVLLVRNPKKIHSVPILMGGKRSFVSVGSIFDIWPSFAVDMSFRHIVSVDVSLVLASHKIHSLSYINHLIGNKEVADFHALEKCSKRLMDLEPVFVVLH